MPLPVSEKQERIRMAEIKKCRLCSKNLNSWDKRLSRTFAYKFPLCEDCIAEEYGMEKEYFRNRMEEIYDMRPCVGL